MSRWPPRGKRDNVLLRLPGQMGLVSSLVEINCSSASETAPGSPIIPPPILAKNVERVSLVPQVHRVPMPVPVDRVRL